MELFVNYEYQHTNHNEQIISLNENLFVLGNTHPSGKNIFSQLNIKLGTCAQSPTDWRKYSSKWESGPVTFLDNLWSIKYYKETKKFQKIIFFFFSKTIIPQKLIKLIFLTLLAVMNIFQGISAPIPWSIIISNTIFNLQVKVVQSFFFYRRPSSFLMELSCSWWFNRETTFFFLSLLTDYYSNQDISERWSVLI